MRSIGELIDWHAATVPARVAIRDHQDRSHTYGDLAEQVRRCASAWTARGVGPSDRVAILARNSPAYIVNILGLRHCGAVPVLLNWRLSSREVGALVALADPVAVLVDAELRDLVAAPTPTHLVEPLPELSGTPGPATPPHPSRDHGDGTFVILHTSGTTGLPKLIPLTNRGQLENVWSMHLRGARFGGGRRHLRHAPMFHMAGLNGVTLPLAVGDELSLLPQFDAERMVDLIEQRRIEFTNAPPAAIGTLLDAIEARDPAPDLSSLEEIWYGTAPIATPLLERALRVLDCGFRQHYGMTEAQVAVSGLEPEDHRRGGEILRSAGRLLPGFDVRLVGSDGNDVAPGQPGELLLRGDLLFSGYCNDPERTAEAIVDGWYRTGDVGRLDDGYLYIVDRAKDMIVSGGENVYPAEVEALLHTHESVAQVAVVGIPHERWGETVHAVVVPKPGRTVTGAELIAWARDRLAHFKCPTSVDVTAALPRNAVGKVDKVALRAPFWRDHTRAVG